MTYTRMFSTLLLRENELSRALDHLGPMDFMVLLRLVGKADPATGTVHLRIEEFASLLATDQRVVLRSLERLAERDFLERVAREGDAELLEIGAILVRRGSPPPNLPVSPSL